MQEMRTIVKGEEQSKLMPTRTAEVLPGIQWGSYDELFTPAYWLGQLWQHELLGTFSHHRLGISLIEEMAACILGGYGMPAELGLKAFERLRDNKLLKNGASADLLENALSKPFNLGGRPRKYRFPRQKAAHLEVCLRLIENIDQEPSDVAFRNQLIENLPGVGPKTASWIVRNHRASNNVAILDVHIIRAGQIIGLFPNDFRLPRDYQFLEKRYLEFATAIGGEASTLDALIWDYMRRSPNTHSIKSFETPKVIDRHRRPRKLPLCPNIRARSH